MTKIAKLTMQERPIGNGPAPQLLAVRAGVSIGDALSEASDTLAVVRDIVARDAGRSDTAILWGGVTLIEIAKGLVDAALEAVGRAEAAAKTEADHA